MQNTHDVVSEFDIRSAIRKALRPCFLWHVPQVHVSVCSWSSQRVHFIESFGWPQALLTKCAFHLTTPHDVHLFRLGPPWLSAHCLHDLNKYGSVDFVNCVSDCHVLQCVQKYASFRALLFSMHLLQKCPREFGASHCAVLLLLQYLFLFYLPLTPSRGPKTLVTDSRHRSFC